MGENTWWSLNMIRQLHAKFLKCCANLDVPATFHKNANEFVNTFVKDEMDDVVERLNLFYKFLNPLARKKLGLLVGKSFATT